MNYAHYQISCRFTTEAVLPAFKGSTLRGGLGHSLKHIACALRRQNCMGCLLSGACAYAFLFEVKKNTLQQPAGKHQGLAQRPHPYVLIPPDTEQQHYQSGEPFHFEMLLFGPAMSYLPHLVFAVQEMGKSGLGKRNNEGFGKFILETVQQNDNVLYRDGVLTATIPPEQAVLEKPSAAAVRNISLTCHTPLRLKQDNQFQDGLPFHLLIRAALRRISALENAYGNGEPPLDYKGLVARAREVTVRHSSCRWVEIKRYSNRQKTTMLMGGIMGTISYEGDNLSDFIPLLRYGEIVHLGKETTFGLGRISLQTNGSA